MMNTMESKDNQEYYRDLKNPRPRKKGEYCYSTLDRGMTESYHVLV